MPKLEVETVEINVLIASTPEFDAASSSSTS
jgi:hypothetical protein